jgi:putative transposase
MVFCMARPLRIEYAGAFYHVMNRGNRSEDIFQSTYDREKFFDYLATIVERFSIKVHTYCLMTNHYHLLVETAEPNLSTAIKWLNGSYATYSNTKRQKWGHLFQGRFKSIVVEADEYLKHLSRYIHLNPVRAKLSESPYEYQWSSYAAFIGKAQPPEWLETGWLLSCFGKNQKESRGNYRQFVEGVDVMSVKNPSDDLTGGLILGNPDFVTWVKKTFLGDKDETSEFPQLRKLKPRLAPETIVGEVCREFGVKKDTIIGKGAKLNVVRDLAIYLSKRHSGNTCKALGQYYGQVSGAAITMAFNRIQTAIDSDKGLKRRMSRIQKRILNI